MKNDFKKEFNEWLSRQGAEVLTPTNSYEIARFIARGATHVIYEGRRGISASGFGEECLEAFRNGANLGMGFTKKPRNQMTRIKYALIQRDGQDCWFCGLKMEDQFFTVEHLVARAKGGPDHIDNLVLAHPKCNRDADNFPLKKKIEIHVSARREL